MTTDKYDKIQMLQNKKEKIKCDKLKKTKYKCDKTQKRTDCKYDKTQRDKTKM